MNPDRGVVFNIQRCSIHDGPGIRTTVFLKGCPLRCFWCQNPESQSGRPEVLWDKRKCTLCGACGRACPSGAACLEAGRPALNRVLCQGCGRCVEICPQEARSLSGRAMRVEEVLREVLRDVKFYEKSGGGVTLSGGEPLAQAGFARSLLRKCKQAGLHTTLDTCGYAPWSTVESLIESVDLVLFDLKHMEAAKHREATGVENALILENARRLAKLKPMRIRVPLIPGFNDSAPAVAAIAAFARNDLGLGCADIDLLPYNRMGEIKYDFLELTPTPGLTQTDDHLQVLEAVLRGQFG